MAERRRITYNLRRVIDENMVEVIVADKFLKFGIQVFREVDLETAVKILECDEKVITDLLYCRKLRGRCVLDKIYIPVDSLYALGKMLEIRNGSRRERWNLHKKFDKEDLESREDKKK